MKAFRFSLQAILTLREEQEQEAQRAYARTLRVVDAVKAKVDAVRRQWENLGVELGQRLHGGLRAEELEQLGRYRVVLEERLARLREELVRAQQASDRAQEVLRKAAQNRQALDNYQQKLHRAHTFAVARAEHNQLDDLAGRAPTLARAWRQAPEPPAP